MRLLAWRHAVGMCTFAYVAGFAIEPRHAAVRFGAGLLAVVAADAERLVDDQHVGRLAEALAHQEVHQRARLRADLHARVVDHAPADVLLQRIEPGILAARQLEEFLALDLDGIGGDGRGAVSRRTGSPISAISPTR